MSKAEIITKTNENKISVCDVMKANTSQIIQKLENQAPARFQQYSDLYSEYLHTIDDLFGTCYISEKEFFDKLNIDQGILKQTKEYSQAITNIITDQIEFAGKYREELIKSQISYLKIFDNFVHVMMDSYAKTLTNANKLSDSFNNSAK
ncbi:MAG: hypothetical protein ACE5DL_00410 [Nitrosopumilaceae archaeon]